MTVTVMRGGLIDTDMNCADGPGAEYLSQIPALGRYAEADEIAVAVACLAGDGSRYVTGRRSSRTEDTQCSAGPPHR